MVLFFSVWLVSHNIIPSRSVYVVSNGKIPFFFCGIYVCMCVCVYIYIYICFLVGASGREPICQCRRHKRLRFNPWVRKIPWGIAWQPTPVFLLGESSWTKETGGLQSIKLQRVRRNLAHTHAYTHTHTHTHTPYLLHSLVY